MALPPERFSPLSRDIDEDERRPPSSSSTSSSRSEHDRRLSGDQRRPPSRQDSRLSTDDPRRRAPSGGNSERRKQSTESDFTLPPSKPQLTQELENQIISGGDVFMKKKRRERIGRQQEERDREKMTREEKLAQVPYIGGEGRMRIRMLFCGSEFCSLLKAVFWMRRICKFLGLQDPKP